MRSRDVEVPAGWPRIPVSEVMSRRVVVVHRHTPIDEVRSVLVDGPYGGVPVVDEEGQLIGMVSRSDLLAEEADSGGLPASKVVAEDLMTQRVLTAAPTETIAHCARVMAHNSVHRLVVLEGRRIVGILTALDLARWMGELDDEGGENGDRLLSGEK